jgi:hypothetical protein
MAGRRPHRVRTLPGYTRARPAAYSARRLAACAAPTDAARPIAATTTRAAVGGLQRSGAVPGSPAPECPQWEHVAPSQRYENPHRGQLPTCPHLSRAPDGYFNQPQREHSDSWPKANSTRHSGQRNAGGRSASTRRTVRGSDSTSNHSGGVPASTSWISANACHSRPHLRHRTNQFMPGPREPLIRPVSNCSKSEPRHCGQASGVSRRRSRMSINDVLQGRSTQHTEKPLQVSQHLTNSSSTTRLVL